MNDSTITAEAQPSRRLWLVLLAGAAMILLALLLLVARATPAHADPLDTGTGSSTTPVDSVTDVPASPPPDATTTDPATTPTDPSTSTPSDPSTSTPSDPSTSTPSDPSASTPTVTADPTAPTPDPVAVAPPPVDTVTDVPASPPPDATTTDPATTPTDPLASTPSDPPASTPTVTPDPPAPPPDPPAPTPDPVAVAPPPVDPAPVVPIDQISDTPTKHSPDVSDPSTVSEPAASPADATVTVGDASPAAAFVGATGSAIPERPFDRWARDIRNAPSYALQSNSLPAAPAQDVPGAPAPASPMPSHAPDTPLAFEASSPSASSTHGSSNVLMLAAVLVMLGVLCASEARRAFRFISVPPRLNFAFAFERPG